MDIVLTVLLRAASSFFVFSAIPHHSQVVMIRALTPSRAAMVSKAATVNKVAMGSRQATGSSPPLVTHLQLDHTARLQANTASRAAAMGNKVSCDSPEH